MRAIALVLGLSVWLLGPVASGQTLIERGEYMLRAGGCVACHTDVDNDGAYLAGGREFTTPFGAFFSPNITPDPTDGIGGWSIADFTTALTRGEGPGGIHYYPVFPYTSYSGMRPEDVQALFAYLRSVEPVPQADRLPDLPWYMQFRFINRVWKCLFFKSTEPPNDMSEPVLRGAYLVTVLGHCGECHTPRNLFGVLDDELFLAGTKDGPDGDAVPNITPDRETGIGRWSRATLIRYLTKGMEPDGDFAGGVMVDVIDESLRHLSYSDIEAIVDYLKSIPPVSNQVGDP